jgi:hypothetical protein
MPKSCAHFKLLHDRVDILSQKFIDDQLAAEIADPITFQPDLDRLAAYRLLVHAEIEDFMEAKAKESLLNIRNRMSGTAPWLRLSPELLPLAIVLKKALPSQEHLEVSKFSDYVDELISGAMAAISENNGVKSNSFLLLSICAGKTVDEIDQALSASLNSYGKARGDVAHKSVIHSHSLQAPSAEQATAKRLVSEIATFFDVCP